MSTRNDWASLDADLDALLDASPADREQRLAQIERDDPARARALRDWLDSINRSEGLFEPPVSVVPAGLGPWRALQSIGQGGMGEVWRGERADGAFQRVVAIKFLRADRGNVSSSIAREREVLARLRHPGIAQLLDGGISTDGRPWLVMEWVDGLTLDHWVRERTPDLRMRVDLLRRVALAVAYAHDNLVVHRDLKPANVMIDRTGEPRLLDFGIARLLEEGTTATQTQDRALTPAFAAPEQLSGGVISTRTDVYALGSLLYRLITDASAHTAEDSSLAELVRRVCHEDPVAPSQSAEVPGIDADLDAIVLTALARDPAQRYATAHELASDLARWLAGDNVSVRLPSRIERIARGLRRHPLETALGAALVLALGVGIAATSWQAQQAKAARAQAERERDVALLEVDRSEHLVDSFARLFRESDGEEKLAASDWLDRAANLPSAPGDVDGVARIRFLSKLAAIEQDRGQHLRAAAVLERVLAAPGTALTSVERAEASCRLATALNWAGRVDDAKSRFASAIAMAEKLQSLDRLALVDCLSGRAGMALAAGSGDPEAVAAADRALAEIARLGNGAGDTRWRRAGVLYTRAALYDLAGDDARAAQGYADVMELDRALGNTESSDHAALLTALAGSLDRAGRLREADARYAEGIALYEKVSGRHPHLASDLANRAMLKNQLGDYAGAEALARRALAMLSALDDVNPLAAANAQFAIGVALREQGRPEDALITLDDAARRYTAASNNPLRLHKLTVARALTELAAGRSDVAQIEIAGVLNWARENKNSRLLASALLAEARVGMARNEPSRAVQSASEAQSLLSQQLPTGHPLWADATLTLCEALFEAGLLDQARSEWARHRSGIEQTLGSTHPRVRVLADLLAR